MKISRIIWLLFVMGLFGGHPFAAEVYTWTDTDGLVHITDRLPPPNTRIQAVVEDLRPHVKMLSPERTQTDAGAVAREQITENQAAWQSVQDLRDKLDAAQAAYEDATAALEAEQAKYAYSAKRRRAPRQSVTELEEAAKTAFAEYRRILDDYHQAELAAREAGQRTRSAIEAVGAERSLSVPDAQSSGTPDRK